MKIVIIKKKNLLFFLIVICIILLFSIILFNNKTNSTQTLYPLDFSKNPQYDLNCDGIKDSLEIVKETIN